MTPTLDRVVWTVFTFTLILLGNIHGQNTPLMTPKVTPLETPPLIKTVSPGKVEQTSTAVSSSISRNQTPFPATPSNSSFEGAGASSAGGGGGQGSSTSPSQSEPTRRQTQPRLDALTSDNSGGSTSPLRLTPPRPASSTSGQQPPQGVGANSSTLRTTPARLVSISNASPTSSNSLRETPPRLTSSSNVISDISVRTTPARLVSISNASPTSSNSIRVTPPRITSSSQSQFGNITVRSTPLRVSSTVGGSNSSQTMRTTPFARPQNNSSPPFQLGSVSSARTTPGGLFSTTLGSAISLRSTPAITTRGGIFGNFSTTSPFNIGQSSISSSIFRSTPRPFTISNQTNSVRTTPQRLVANSSTSGSISIRSTPSITASSSTSSTSKPFRSTPQVSTSSQINIISSSGSLRSTPPISTTPTGTSSSTSRRTTPLASTTSTSATTRLIPALNTTLSTASSSTTFSKRSTPSVGTTSSSTLSTTTPTTTTTTFPSSTTTLPSSTTTLPSTSTSTSTTTTTTTTTTPITTTTTTFIPTSTTTTTTRTTPTTTTSTTTLPTTSTTTTFIPTSTTTRTSTTSTTTTPPSTSTSTSTTTTKTSTSTTTPSTTTSTSTTTPSTTTSTSTSTSTTTPRTTTSTSTPSPSTTSLTTLQSISSTILITLSSTPSIPPPTPPPTPGPITSTYVQIVFCNLYQQVAPDNSVLNSYLWNLRTQIANLVGTTTDRIQDLTIMAEPNTGRLVIQFLISEGLSPSTMQILATIRERVYSTTDPLELTDLYQRILYVYCDNGRYIYNWTDYGPCPRQMCYNGGICGCRPAGRFYCICKDGYSGEFCEIAPYTSKPSGPNYWPLLTIPAVIALLLLILGLLYCLKYCCGWTCACCCPCPWCWCCVAPVEKEEPTSVIVEVPVVETENVYSDLRVQSVTSEPQHMFYHAVGRPFGVAFNDNTFNAGSCSMVGPSDRFYTGTSGKKMAIVYDDFGTGKAVSEFGGKACGSTCGSAFADSDAYYHALGQKLAIAFNDRSFNTYESRPRQDKTRLYFN